MKSQKINISPSELFLNLEKTTDLPYVTDKLYHINVGSSTPGHERNSNSQL